MTQPITERPILFSGPMVKAILEGQKTQTRRVINLQPVKEDDGSWSVRTSPLSGYSTELVMRHHLPLYCRYGQPGERLWVRETFLPVVGQNDKGESGWFEWAPENKDDKDERPEEILYRATDDVHPKRWRPAIHMPRWASRIELEVVSVRVERIQEITKDGCVAEGVNSLTVPVTQLNGKPATGFVFDPVYKFIALWNTINEKRGFGWDKNPWVWVIEFKRVESKQ